MSLGAPRDEYALEVGAIVPRLTTVTGPSDVQRVLHEEFLRWFGHSAGPVGRYAHLADAVWTAVLTFRTARGSGKPREAPSSSTHTNVDTLNQQVLRQAIDDWNRGDLAQYLRLYADDLVIHGYAGLEPGLANVRRFYESWWVAFPGSQLMLDDLIAAGDKVACRVRIEGTHDGPFQAIPASGRPVSVVAFTILRFVEGKCVERWSLVDSMALLTQIGAMG